MNTLHQGEFSILIVQNDKNDVIAICPEFAIVKHGNDFNQVHEDMLGASKAYLTAVAENNLPHELLNRMEELPEKYQILYQIVTDKLEKKQTKNTLLKKLPKTLQQAVKSGNAFVAPVFA